MLTKIYIVSGFLGAGKTTLIQKMLKEAFQNEKTAVIENDFGDISIDADLLSTSGVVVRSINSGCICCSLSGDFAAALSDLLKQYQPERIIIEPSGVGKLSDIMKVCKDERLAGLAVLEKSITVADVKRCEMYLENFGEFFEDQIKNADLILLSRSEKYKGKIPPVSKILTELNPNAPIIGAPFESLNMNRILENPNHSNAHCACGCHGHNHHSCGCSCGSEAPHTHAQEMFETVTLKIEEVFSREEWQRRFGLMEGEMAGAVLRAKGIVKGKEGYFNLQYTPGELAVTAVSLEGNRLSFIGRGLQASQLARIFSRM